MMHIILISVVILCQIVLLLVALSGIKFYTLNSEVEAAPKDASKLKLITFSTFVLACLAAVAILLF